MVTINKLKLITEISKGKRIPLGDVRHILEAFFDEMIENLLSGNRIEFRDFGVFKIVMRKAKLGRNPKKPAVPIVIPPRLTAKFNPGKKMCKRIERKRPI